MTSRRPDPPPGPRADRGSGRRADRGPDAQPDPRGPAVDRGPDNLRLRLTLSALALAQIVSSFGVQWTVVARLGTHVETDALYAGMTLPQIVTTMAVESLTFVLIPLFSALPERERRRHAWSMVAVIVGLAAVLIAVLDLAAPLLLRLTVPGFTPQARELCVRLTRIQLNSLLGAAAFSVLAALEHARNRFRRVAASVLVCTVVGWAVLLRWLGTGGIVLAVWVQVLMLGGPALLLLPAAGRPAGIAGSGELLREVWRRVRPLVLGATYYRTGFVVDRLLASFLAPGSIVILELAQRIDVAVVRVLNQGIVTPVVPRLARLAEQGQSDAFRALVRQRALWAAALGGAALCAISLAVLVNRNGLETVARAAGKLTHDDLRTLCLVFLCAGGVLLTGSVNHMLTSAWYAQGDTRTPTRIGVTAYTVGLGLKALGFRLGGLEGIALGISAYYGLHWFLLERALGRGKARGSGRNPGLLAANLRLGDSTPRVES
jgi:putative peptidoglycan lipid II flippase